jgi:hypothetical protein
MVNMLRCFTIDNYLNLASIILVMIGGIPALIQWHSGIKVKRAEFLEKIISKLRFDEEIIETMYMIDYNYAWYNENFHNNKMGPEKSIDKLLSYFDYICYLEKIKNITQKEFVIIKYEVNRILNSPCVENYLWNLYHFSIRNNTHCSFTNLIDHGIKNGRIDKIEFYNKNNIKYNKYLNF